MKKNELIRNFCIIAHIDHGKSTLADRLLVTTGAISLREFREQLLDDMDLERERGITIKSSAVRLSYQSKDGPEYILNLIDTPGHVDFSYEVSKALTACEGALLLVDAAQGVEAQTVANLYQALNHELKIIPIINKIDLTNAQIELTAQQISDILEIDERDIIRASAKEGVGIRDILERIIRDVPHPQGSPEDPLQALIFDSVFNTYKGVIVYIRVFSGCIEAGMNIEMMAIKQTYTVQEVGIFRPKPQTINRLEAGEVGYLTCNLRDARHISIGDTITNIHKPCAVPLTGYREVNPMVFCGIYPSNAKDFAALKEAITKLALNDSSFIFEIESSPSLGYGFRCGFQGLLHMEIIQERLEREYDLNLVLTTPSVKYVVTKKRGETLEVDNPSLFPPPQEIEYISEPFVKATLMVPQDCVGPLMELSIARRGIYKSTEYLGENRARMFFEFPLSEIIVDFYDKLKSSTRGYGSMEYAFLEYRKTDVVKMDILINGQPCDALSSLLHKEKAEYKGRQLLIKLKELIPRQLFEVVIQAAIGNRILARERVPPLSKHVTGKCYGGDITRKRKLWEKQRMGKKRMKKFGKVDIPQEAFLAVLKL
ncbi:MAG: elongation factor 4 [Candidatus Omnitrophica bacterium]|nr:elongation factor 4 [Candidatus Omnitrophota bacterium]